MRFSFLLLFLASLISVAVQPTTGKSPAGIFYEVSGAGAPVVFVHGFSMDRRAWKPQIEHFEGPYRVIRYDLRGHGNSAGPEGPYNAHDDLRSVLDTLGIEKAALVGLSAGAQVATNFALMHPDRVSRMVLAAPGLGGYVPKEPLAFLKPVFEAAAGGDPERAAKLWLETPIMTLRSNQAAASELRTIVMENSKLWSYKSNPDQQLKPPAIQRLPEIRCPVLVLIGEHDLDHIVDIANILSTGIPGAKLVRIPQAGHILNLDSPALFNKTVDAFLRQP
jgi:3-oxoadipate enol-lactonase